MSDEAFSRVLDELRADPRVGEGKIFGHRAAKLDRKVFACLYEGELSVRLGAGRVDELVAAGDGERFEPMPGRAMRGWLVVPAPGEHLGIGRWLELCDEAKALLASELDQPIAPIDPSADAP